jgi:hypothetical protein
MVFIEGFDDFWVDNDKVVYDHIWRHSADEVPFVVD